MTTTMTERLDHATYQRKWAAELRAYADQAAEQWMAIWTEHAQQVRALHTEVDLPVRTVPTADELLERVEDRLGAENHLVPVTVDAESYYGALVEFRVSLNRASVRELTPANLDREATLRAMTERARQQDTLRRAAEGATAPALLAGPAHPELAHVPAYQGPRSRISRWVDERMRRAEDRWRRSDEP